jgi:hypothetical protein
MRARRDSIVTLLTEAMKQRRKILNANFHGGVKSILKPMKTCEAFNNASAENFIYQAEDRP